MRRWHGPEPFIPTSELGPFELRVNSQNGEDGVIAEILRRTGVSSDPYFVEFGIQRGVEGNCVVLADLLGWRGLFIEAEADEFEHLQSKYRWTPVTTRRTMVTSDNVQTVFAEAGVPEEPDVPRSISTVATIGSGRQSPPTVPVS